MEILDINSLKYPEMLKRLKDPPNKIYVEGNVDILSLDGIAIIGSRICSEYGRKQGIKFAKELSNEGLSIISGMAKGIDSAAHKGCLKANGKTIAVLGSGFNNIYPEENIDLFYEIIKSGGAVISEYAPNIMPRSEHFIKRNRIVSGLAKGTLVIEAAHRSGTSITAKMTREQGKPIFCIPNNLENKKGVGTNRLLQKDAILVMSVDDIINRIDISKDNIKNKKEIIPVQSSLFETQVQVNEEYKPIYNLLLNKESLHINEIAKKVKQPLSQVSYLLTMMELEGYIQALPGNMFSKKEAE